MKCRKICAEQVGRYGKPILRVYCRTEDKRKFAINVDGLPSYFYVDREPVYFGDKLSKVEKIESGYYSIYGRPLWKVYTKAPGDTKQLREGYNHYEADIHWTERACIDLQLTDGFEYEDGKIIPCGNVDHIKLRTWILDVEVISPPTIVPTFETPQFQTACVVIYDNYDDKIYTFSTKDVSEETMWGDFIEFIRSKNPDIITGWNIGYDISWILARFEFLKLDPNTLSPMQRAGFRHWTAPDGKVITNYDIAGRIIFDGLEAYKVKKNPSGQLSSYNLHSVAEHEGLGEWEDLGAKIQSSWANNPQDVIDYCIKDVEHEKEIIFKERLIEQALTLCRLSGCTPPQTTKKEAIIDHALLLRRGTRILPSKRRRDGITARTEVKGGAVLVPSAGIHRGLGVFDAAALYPSIIDGFNISPETKNEHGTIRIKDEDGHEYRFLDAKIKKGIMPECIVEFRKLREDVRQKKYKAEATFGHDSLEYKALEEEDTADKFIITSFYGVNGFPGFRLFDPDCANAITAVGRSIITGLVSYLGDRGYPVEYGDTDSVFVTLRALENGDKVSSLITRFLEEKLQAMGVNETAISVKFEKYFNWCIFKRRKVKKGVYEAVKKKYVAHMTWSEGQVTDYMYIRGFETRRSDSSIILKSTMEAFFETMRLGDFDKALLSLKELKKDWQLTMPYDMAIPRKVTKEKVIMHRTNKWGTKTETVVRNPWIEGKKRGKEYGWMYDEATAPRLLYLKGTEGKDRDQSVICIQKHHRLPEDLLIDYDLMFEKNITKKFKDLVTAMDKNWEVEVEGKMRITHKQSGLDGFT